MDENLEPLDIETFKERLLLCEPHLMPFCKGQRTYCPKITATLQVNQTNSHSKALQNSVFTHVCMLEETSTAQANKI